jgi:hypothetical protein
MRNSIRRSRRWWLLAALLLQAARASAECYLSDCQLPTAQACIDEYRRCEAAERAERAESRQSQAASGTQSAYRSCRDRCEAEKDACIDACGDGPSASNRGWSECRRDCRAAAQECREPCLSL